jgi:hypothetical protein
LARGVFSIARPDWHGLAGGQLFILSNCTG